LIFKQGDYHVAHRDKVGLNAGVQLFSSSRCLELCMAEDYFLFSFLKEWDQNFWSSGIFEMKQNRRMWLIEGDL
jgi:hypothetical protein